VSKALVGLIAAPRSPAVRPGEVGPAATPEPPDGANRASTVAGATVLIAEVASRSIVRVAEASDCANPSIVGASAVVAGVRVLVAGAGARPAGVAPFVAERSLAATALLTGAAAAVVAGARACATGVAALVTGAGSFGPAAPLVVELGGRSCPSAAALVTAVAALVTGAMAWATARAAFGVGTPTADGRAVPDTGAVGF
jgi:hypothetical protein